MEKSSSKHVSSPMLRFAPLRYRYGYHRAVVPSRPNQCQARLPANSLMLNAMALFQSSCHLSHPSHSLVHRPSRHDSSKFVLASTLATTGNLDMSHEVSRPCSRQRARARP